MRTCSSLSSISSFMHELRWKNQENCHLKPISWCSLTTGWDGVVCHSPDFWSCSPDSTNTVHKMTAAILLKSSVNKTWEKESLISSNLCNLVLLFPFSSIHSVLGRGKSIASAIFKLIFRDFTVIRAVSEVSSLWNMWNLIILYYCSCRQFTLHEPFLFCWRIAQKTPWWFKSLGQKTCVKGQSYMSGHPCVNQ